jgi:hypothetical protein
MRQTARIAARCGTGLLILLLAAAAAPAQSTLQVRVKDAAAVIRMAPEATSPVILPAVKPGAVFNVQRRMGDWFEIKFVAASGVLLTGYIHRFQVEEVVPDAFEGRGQTRPDTGPDFESPLRTGLEIGLSAGMGFNRFTGGESNYAITRDPAGDLLAASEMGYITTALGNPDLGGIFAAYFFTPGIGLRIQWDGRLKQSLKEGYSNYGASWTLTGADAANKLRAWQAAGSFTVSAASVDLIGRLALGPVVTAFVSGGPSYFSGSFSVDSSIGYGRAWIDGVQKFDFFTLPVKMNSSISGLGFNAGAGLEVWINRSLTMVLEGSYYSAPSAEAAWVVQSGSYPSNAVEGVTWTDPDLPARLAGYVAPLTVNLSYVKASIGLKIHL